MTKTYMPKAGDIKDTWWVVDADGQILGRLATRVATILRGKHRPEYSPHFDFGDHVVIINASKVRLTGEKSSMKRYERFTGFPGGRRVIPITKMRPERVVEHAVKGMLPHTKLGRELFRKLKVYAGPDHPHIAQQPAPLPLEPVEGSQ
ncbi:50S ribosomal protein L13 [Candidatus Fermentibacteria bacterium]|nr:50S ribosomal protein L13 [Candidatus Fermentibacteria bacterium]